LFRDENHWEWFCRSLIPKILACPRRRSERQTLRIWSAGCSTGDEPMTAACCLAAELPNFSQWNVEILGTDLGTGVLEQAKTALFGERAMRLVPESCRRRFFIQLPNMKIWRAQPVVADLIRYRQHNLMTPLPERPFDLVLLKNVLIYFDVASRQRAMAHVRAAVRPGGVLLTGAAEGVAEWIKDWKRLQPWAYCKSQK